MIFILTLLMTLAAFIVWRSSTRKAKQGNAALQPVGMGGLFATGAFGVLALAQCFTQVSAGRVGVIDFFGIVSERTLPAGINLVNPLASAIKFSIQTKEHKETMEVPLTRCLSREGLTIGLEISALYRLNPDSAARVYTTVAGGDYETISLSHGSARSAAPSRRASRPVRSIQPKGTSSEWQSRTNLPRRLPLAES